jgi:purine catabolism regulator
VLGAAVVEVESAARWIAPEWVLLTAGVRLEGSSDEAFRALVAECDEAGIAALGFGVGPVLDELPQPLLEEGEARGFPIVAVPIDTPFREVVRFVDTAIMGADAPLLRRLSSLQRFVVDALQDAEPEHAVVERLARFMDASAAVLAPTGEPEIARGSAPFDALWAAVDDRRQAVQEAEAGGWHAVAAPLAPASRRAGSCSLPPHARRAAARLLAQATRDDRGAPHRAAGRCTKRPQAVLRSHDRRGGARRGSLPAHAGSTLGEEMETWSERWTTSSSLRISPSCWERPGGATAGHGPRTTTWSPGGGWAIRCSSAR